MPIRFISATTSRPKSREPAQHRLVGGRVGPRHVVVVGQGQVAHPEPVQHPQGAERPVDLVAALGPHQAGDPALLPGPLDVLDGGRERQLVGVPPDHGVARASTCSSVAVTAASPASVAGTNTDQNCAPTPPARSRGRSVWVPSAAADLGVGQVEPVEVVVDRSAPPTSRSLCPSTTGCSTQQQRRSGSCARSSAPSAPVTAASPRSAAQQRRRPARRPPSGSPGCGRRARRRSGRRPGSRPSPARPPRRAARSRRGRRGRARGRGRCGAARW